MCVPNFRVHCTVGTKHEVLQFVMVEYIVDIAHMLFDLEDSLPGCWVISELKNQICYVVNEDQLLELLASLWFEYKKFQLTNKFVDITVTSVTSQRLFSSMESIQRT